MVEGTAALVEGHCQDDEEGTLAVVTTVVEGTLAVVEARLWWRGDVRRVLRKCILTG